MQRNSIQEWKFVPTQFQSFILLHSFLLNIKKVKWTKLHGVWKSQRKSLIQQCERSELRLHFKRTKVPKLETYSQTVLPDMSILIGQKLLDNAKIEKNCEILSDFQTLWASYVLNYIFNIFRVSFALTVVLGLLNIFVRKWLWWIELENL